MIKERIYAYLASKGKKLDEAVLDEMMRQIRRAVRLRYMTDKEDDKGVGRLYASRLSWNCARKIGYAYHGFPEERDEPEPRRSIGYMIGDVVEAAVLGLAMLAGCDIARPFDLLKSVTPGEPMERLTISRNSRSFPCWPDGLAQEAGTFFNLEVKSMNGYVFDRDVRAGKVDNTWGYVTQCQFEMLAWQQAGLDVMRTLFLGINKLNGHLHEWTILYDDRAVQAAFDRGELVQASGRDSLPPRGVEPEREVVKKKATGRLKLAPVCAFCGWKVSCWGELQVVVKSGRPTFYLPAESAKRFTEPLIAPPPGPNGDGADAVLDPDAEEVPF